MNCLYCHTECPGEYCSAECQKKCEEFESYVKEFTVHFLFLLFASMLFIVPTLVFMNLFYIGIMLGIMGMTMAIFPFGTDWNIQKWGLRGSINVIRTCGIAMGLAGLVMVVLMWPF